MNDGLTFALFDYWWAWNAPRTRKAVWTALAPHFGGVVESPFGVNRAAGRKPSSWSELIVLGRTEQTIERGLAGKQNMTLEFILGVACLLNIEPSCLVPNRVPWVASAATLLASQERTGNKVFPTVVGFNRAEAEEYTRAVLSKPPRDGRAVARGEVDDFLARCPLAVRKVAVRIGPILAACYDSMTEDTE